MADHFLSFMAFILKSLISENINIELKQEKENS